MPRQLTEGMEGWSLRRAYDVHVLEIGVEEAATDSTGYLSHPVFYEGGDRGHGKSLTR